MGCDSFSLSFRTKVRIKTLKNLNDFCDLSKSDKNQYFFSKVEKKLLVNLKNKHLNVFGLTD